MSMCYWCVHLSYCQDSQKERYKAVDDGVMYCVAFRGRGLPALSMAWTTPAWVNKAKIVTRRNWSVITKRKYRNQSYYMAWSRQARYGGEPIGIGRLTADPFKESTIVNSKAEDVKALHKAEGFDYLDSRYMNITDYHEPCPLMLATGRWILSDLLYTVVPFEVLEVFPGMQEKYSTDEMIKKAVKALLKELP